jgi:hypothetical protein
MAVFLMAVIVLGYVVIWAIWHFFFREAGDHVPGDGPGGSARTGPQATTRAAQPPGRTIDEDRQG